MKNAKILMTGVTSFTGCYIARALLAAGHSVTGVLTRSQAAYTDSLIQKRLKFSGLKTFLEEAPLGSEKFMEAMGQGGFEVFVSHGAAIQGYRSPDFDYLKSVSESLKSIREAFKLAKAKGLKGVVYTGTVFEPVDGFPAASPYGLSKQMVWDAYAYFCQLNALALTKIWIPNPIGAYENEDRLLPIFAKQWKQGQTPKLTVPRLVYDHVPAEWLASFYVRAVAEMNEKPELRHFRPSAFVLSNQELVDRFRAGLGDKHEYLVSEDPHFKLGATRKNTDPCPELSDPAKVEAFWKSYADYWRG